MAEPKTNCCECGRQILQRTADNCDGMCVPCARKAAAIVPPHFQLPDELAGYLISVGKDPADYLEMAWRSDADFVYGFVKKELERDALYREWSPRLMDFVKECRRRHPAPRLSTLGKADQAKATIYRKKITDLLGPRPGLITMFSAPLVGIAAAESLWPGESEDVVLLTAEERKAWDAIYSHPEGVFNWIVHYSCRIDVCDRSNRQLSGRVAEMREDIDALPQGIEAWIVDWGWYWGPLSACQETELWAWDGQTARRTDCTIVMMS